MALKLKSQGEFKRLTKTNPQLALTYNQVKILTPFICVEDKIPLKLRRKFVQFMADNR